MTHGHHEYLFDYRYKDLETGKLNIDKLHTLNSNTSIDDLMEPGREPSYEYCMMKERLEREQELRCWESREERSARERKEEEEREAKKARAAQEQVRLRLIKREEEERQAHEKVVTQYTIFGNQRIITSKWKVG